MYTGRQVLERDSNWNGVQNTNLHLAYLRNLAEIKSKPSRLIGPWRPYDCDVTYTWGNGTVPIAVATVLGGFLTFIWFCYLIFATITSNNDGIRGRLSYLSWQIMTATAQWVKFFIFKFSLKKCSNYMSPGVHVYCLPLENTVLRVRFHPSEKLNPTMKLAIQSKF